MCDMLSPGEKAHNQKKGLPQEVFLQRGLHPSDAEKTLFRLHQWVLDIFKQMS